MGWLTRLEFKVRAHCFGAPFVLTNLLSRYEIDGQENLDHARELCRQEGCGMVSISNHVSLFDDPLVLTELLGIRRLTNETKVWWSTPCESNFSPAGGGLAARWVRYFSAVSNMVFFARPAKKGGTLPLPDSYHEALRKRGGPALAERLEARASQEGMVPESWLRTFVTPGDSGKLAALNQTGMVDASARVALGDWLHFFPEGGRSRALHLRPPRRGVGKVLYHNPDAVVLPFCLHGTQDVLPIGSFLPRPGHRVVVTVGEPIRARDCFPADGGTGDRPPFEAIAGKAWEHVKALRPLTLARYLGPARATALLRIEAPAAHRPAGESMAQPALLSASEATQPRQDVAQL